MEKDVPFTTLAKLRDMLPLLLHPSEAGLGAHNHVFTPSFEQRRDLPHAFIAQLERRRPFLT